jgi:hypothetical protein
MELQLCILRLYETLGGLIEDMFNLKDRLYMSELLRDSMVL